MLKELGYEGVGHIWLDGFPSGSRPSLAGLKLYQITMTVDLTPGKPAMIPASEEVVFMAKGRHEQFNSLMR